MKKWKPERRDGLLLLGIGLGAAVGLLRGAVLAWLPVGVALGLCLRGGAGTRSGSGKDSFGDISSIKRLNPVYISDNQNLTISMVMI
ncbi:hypothetical protein [Alistipes putredinis]|uniref:hypothetical protein n=1 Tax=Alistipes putredinis TaxID=28117 RepID=UPI003A890DA6